MFKQFITAFAVTFAAVGCAALLYLAGARDGFDYAAANCNIYASQEGATNEGIY